MIAPSSFLLDGNNNNNSGGRRRRTRFKDKNVEINQLIQVI